jgi:DEAD/DEAH box helicase domain-containing protein
VFAQSRLATEILTTYLKDDFEKVPGMADQIRGYRGGYLPLRRREIEKGLREGSVKGVVSTNALELGIDIGALDVSIMAGYPGTIAATWQRAGRAGRRTARSAAVMVASSAPVDQFIVKHPSYFFDASPEHALVNPDNLHILVDHVKCAAFELPFTSTDTFGTVDAGGDDPARERARTSLGRSGRRGAGAVALDERELPGGCREPAFDHLRQLRDRGRRRRRARHR